MEKRTEHCDVCDKRIDFYDADGDSHIDGIRGTGSMGIRSSYNSLVACYGGDIAELVDFVVCSPPCLDTYLKKALQRVFANWRTPLPKD